MRKRAPRRVRATAPPVLPRGGPRNPIRWVAWRAEGRRRWLWLQRLSARNVEGREARARSVRVNLSGNGGNIEARHHWRWQRASRERDATRHAADRGGNRVDQDLMCPALGRCEQAEVFPQQLVPQRIEPSGLYTVVAHASPLDCARVTVRFWPVVAEKVKDMF